MIRLPDGRYTEIHLNSLGVPNRMNIAQLYEQLINHISDHIISEMKKMTSVQDKLDLYFEYLKYLNKEQCSFMEGEVYQMNRVQQAEFIKEIEDSGIYVHEPPFFNNTKYEDLKRMRIEHPEWCDKYKCTYKGKPIERKLVIGDEYFIRLKHEASNKSSFISTATTNTKNIPSKTNAKKTHKTLFLDSPISLGSFNIAEYKLYVYIKILIILRKSVGQRTMNYGLSYMEYKDNCSKNYIRNIALNDYRKCI